MNADILESRAARAHWLKLADKALKGAYFNETLVSAEGTAAPADLGFDVVIQIPGWEIRDSKLLLHVNRDRKTPDDRRRPFPVAPVS